MTKHTKLFIFLLLTTQLIYSFTPIKTTNYSTQPQPQTIYRDAFFFYNGEQIDLRISIDVYDSREYGKVIKLNQYFYSGDVCRHFLSNRGYLSGDVYALNPNNPVAVNYNVTHFSETGTVGTVYFRL